MRKLGYLLKIVTAGVLVAGAGLVFATGTASAQTPTTCDTSLAGRNTYPELCTVPGDPNTIDIGLFDTLEDYLEAQGALGRQSAGDDTAPGNGIPDSAEIAVCGAAGCMTTWLADATPEGDLGFHTECSDSPTSYEYTLPEGFNTNKAISVLDYSPTGEVIVHYFGPYPASGKVTINLNPPDLAVGTHKFVVIGTDASVQDAKVVVLNHEHLAGNCVEETTSTTGAGGSTTTTKKSAQTTTTGSSVKGASTAKGSSGGTGLKRTGTDALRLVLVGAALLVAGGAVVTGARKRRSDES